MLLNPPHPPLGMLCASDWPQVAVRRVGTAAAAVMVEVLMAVAGLGVLAEAAAAGTGRRERRWQR